MGCGMMTCPQSWSVRSQWLKVGLQVDVTTRSGPSLRARDGGFPLATGVN